MTLILGIDPGSRRTGFGVINQVGARCEYITSGTIRLDPQAPMPERLHLIFHHVSELISEYRPETLAIEQAFLSRNVDTALKLGQARGAVLVAAVRAGLATAEYPPATIKQSLVGNGRAAKQQVAHMVTHLLKLPAAPAEDAADALACALTHAHALRARVQVAGAYARGRYRARSSTARSPKE